MAQLGPQARASLGARRDGLAHDPAVINLPGCSGSRPAVPNCVVGFTPREAGRTSLREAGLGDEHVLLHV